MLDLEDLRAFAEVAASGGLTSAAARLGASKSVVSRRLSRLEAEVGAQLVARTTRGVALTEAGTTFAEHAARILAEVESARDAVAGCEETAGLLRLAAPQSFGPDRLTALLAELALRHPRLEIQVSFSDQFVDLIGEGFDAAIRLGTLRDSSLVARKINGLGLGLFASPAYLEKHGTPKVPSDLLQHEALVRGGDVWRLMDHGREVAIHPRGRFRADSGPAIAAAARAGLGIAGLPSILYREPVERGELVQVLADYPMPEGGLYVVRPPPAGPAPRKVAALIEIMLERFGPGTACDEAMRGGV